MNSGLEISNTFRVRIIKLVDEAHPLNLFAKYLYSTFNAFSWILAFIRFSKVRKGQYSLIKVFI